MADSTLEGLTEKNKILYSNYPSIKKKKRRKKKKRDVSDISCLLKFARCMARWMDGYMDEWVCGWMCTWIVDGCTDGMNELVDKWQNGCTEERMGTFSGMDDGCMSMCLGAGQM